MVRAYLNALELDLCRAYHPGLGLAALFLYIKTVLATSTWGFAPLFRPSGSYVNQSHPPTIDYSGLDGYLLPTIWQSDGLAAGQGEE